MISEEFPCYYRKGKQCAPGLAVKDARKVLKDAFEEDPDFIRVYVANIACAIHDHVETRMGWKKCNAVADSVFHLIFMDDRR